MRYGEDVEFYENNKAPSNSLPAITATHRSPFHVIPVLDPETSADIGAWGHSRPTRDGDVEARGLSYPGGYSAS